MHNVDVAILIDDLEEVKKISSIFREMDIVPYYYEDLGSFWNGVLENIPSLAIVDVKKVSEKDLVLVRHPYVKSGQLHLAFYYTDDTRLLLYSTFDVVNFGLIHQTTSYKGQLKSILKRLNAFTNLNLSNHELNLKNQKQEKQIYRLAEKLENYKEVDFYYKKLKSICFAFEGEKVLDHFDFFKACEGVFDKFDEIFKFALLELDVGGQKLVSPSFVSRKYTKIPPMSLGQTCHDGIEFFAQNLANQAGIELIGGDMISLLIHGTREHPEKIILLGITNQDFLNNFDWEFLENYLSGTNLHYQNLALESANSREEDFLSPWSLMSTLDQQFSKASPADDDNFSLVDLDFSKLIKTIRSKMGATFYWNGFYKEFINKFRNCNTDIEWKIACMGVDHIGFVVAKKMEDEAFLRLKSYIHKYPYWRYFEADDSILTEDLRPKIRSIPISVESYLRHVKGETLLQTNRERKSILHEA